MAAARITKRRNPFVVGDLATLQVHEHAAVPPLLYGQQILLLLKDLDGLVQANASGHFAFPTVKADTLELHTLSSGVPDLRACVFEIRPKPRCKYQTQYSHELELVKEALQTKHKKSLLEDDMALLSAETNDLDSLKSLAESEVKDNTAEYCNRKGHPVRYGETVCLYHVQTDSCVSSTSNYGRQEPGFIRILLTQTPSTRTWFKILPRYKVRATGQSVYVTDTVLFEAIATPNTFLHVSRDPLSKLWPDNGFHEVNLAQYPTSITLLSHRAAQYVKGSSCKSATKDSPLCYLDHIQLFHADRNGCLAAQVLGGVDVATPHIRVSGRAFKSWTQHIWSTSATTYWQFESVKSMTDGGPVCAKDIVAIKHIPTQLYLAFRMRRTSTLSGKRESPSDLVRVAPTAKKASAVKRNTSITVFSKTSKQRVSVASAQTLESNMVLCLVDSSTIVSAHFQLFPLSSEEEEASVREAKSDASMMPGGALLDNSAVRIKHVQSGQWVSTSKVATPVPTLRPIHDRVGDIPVNVTQWETLHSHALELVNDMPFGDAFHLHALDAQTIQASSVVNSMSRVLVHVQQVYGLQLTEEGDSSLVSSLLQAEFEWFCRWIDDEDQHTTRIRRCFVRDARILDMVFNTLQHVLPRAKGARDAENKPQKMANSLFDVIAANTAHKDLATQLYTSQFLAFLLEHVPLYQGAARAVMSLLEDNVQIINQLKYPQVASFVQGACRYSDPLYLKILSLICFANKTPIHRWQNKVAHLLFRYPGANTPFYMFLIPQTSLVDLSVSINRGTTWMNLKELTPQQHNFLQHQLQLYSSLLAGCEPNIAQLIVTEGEEISASICARALCSTKHPPKTLAAFARLLRQLLDDFHSQLKKLPHQPVFLDSHLYNWNRMNYTFWETEQMAVEHPQAALVYFDSLKNILLHLSLRTQIVVCEEDEVSCTYQLLKALHRFLQYGYVTSHTKADQISALVTSILDGTTDIPCSKPKHTPSEGQDELADPAIELWDKHVNQWKSSSRFQNCNANASVFKLKRLCLKILQFLFDMSVKARTEMILIHFRFFLDPQTHESDDDCRPPDTAHGTQRQLRRVARLGVSEYLGAKEELRNYIQNITSCACLTSLSPTVISPILRDIIHSDEPDLQASACDLLFKTALPVEVLLRQLNLAQISVVPERLRVSSLLRMTHALGFRLTAGPVPDSHVSLLVAFFQKLEITCSPIFQSTSVTLEQADSVSSSLLHIINRILAQNDQPGELLVAIFDFFNAMMSHWDSPQRFLFQKIENLHRKCSHSIRAINAFARCLSTCIMQNRSLRQQFRAKHVNLFLESVADHLSTCGDVFALLHTCYTKQCAEAVKTAISNFIQLRMDEMAEACRIGQKFLSSNIEALTSTSTDDGDHKSEALHAHLEFVNLLSARSISSTTASVVTIKTQGLLPLSSIIDVLRRAAISHDNMQPYLLACTALYWDRSSFLDHWTQKHLETGFQIMTNLIQNEMFETVGAFTHDQHVFIFHRVFAFLDQLLDAATFPLAQHLKVTPTILVAISLISETVSFFHSANIQSFQSEYRAWLDSLLARLELIAQEHPAPTKKSSYGHEHGQMTMTRSMRPSQDSILPASISRTMRPTRPPSSLRSSQRPTWNSVSSTRLPSGIVKSYGRNQRPVSQQNEMKNFDEDVNRRWTQFVFSLGLAHGAIMNDITRTQELAELADTIRRNLLSGDSLDQRNTVEMLSAALYLNRDLRGDPVILPHFLSVREFGVTTCLELILVLLGQHLADVTDVEDFLEADTQDEERQNDIRLALTPLVVPILVLLSTTCEPIPPLALKCLNCLLHNGFKPAQDAALRFFQASSQEDFFLVVEAEFLAAIDVLSQDLTTSSFSVCVELLKLVSSMCEGFNTEMKRYFRVQADNLHSVRTVELMSQLLVTASNTHPSMHILELMQYCCLAITEVCQGDEMNLSVLASPSLFSAINMLLGTRVLPGQDLHAEWLELKQAIAMLLWTFFELETPAMSHISARATLLLSSRRMNMCLNDMFEQSSDIEVGCEIGSQTKAPLKQRREALEQAGFRIYCTLTRMQQFAAKPVFMNPRISTQNEIKSNKRAQEYFSTHLRTIEIAFDGSLQEIPFLHTHRDFHLSFSEKQKLLLSCDRTTPDMKRISLLEEAMKRVPDVKYWTKTRTPTGSVAGFMAAGNTICQRFFIVLTLVLNCLVLASWSAPERTDRGGYVIMPQINDPRLRRALSLLGGLHIVSSWWLFATVLALYPISWKVTLSQLPWIGQYFPDHQPCMTRNSILSPRILYHFAIPIFSILAFKFDGYFYWFHLFHVTYGNDILNRVQQALLGRFSALLWVLSFLIVIIYGFTMLSFAFLREEYDIGEAFHCESLVECTVTNIHWGFLLGEGIGGGLSVSETQPFPAFVLHAIFDIAFFLLITIIGLNLVFGIIVDAFAELRDEKFQLESEFQTTCFICGLTSSELHHVPGQFEYHVNHVHNMWSYCYFIWNLMQRPFTEDTMLDHHIRSHLKSKDAHRSLPSQTCRGIEASGSDDMIKDTLREVRFLRQLVTDTTQQVANN
eukprot:m.306572 g.306572  ORF g.306572 m.306572 type:complete len:2556 (-) comp15925_c0_seq1:549-8216(-)